jgi:hypothetical protein
MAPEQYLEVPFDTSNPIAIDVFALGVLAFEIFADGLHPIGVVTADVWPWQKGMVNKWKEERPWRRWAEAAGSCLPDEDSCLPIGVGELVRLALASDPARRPSLEAFENCLWESLLRVDAVFHENLRDLIAWREANMSDEPWPHMDDRMTLLRRFYSET